MSLLKLLVLPEVERLSITLLMDNYTDRLLPSSGQLIIRPPMTKNERFLIHPIAEYGFSALIKVSCNNEKEMENTNKISKESSTFLFDCGISENGVIYNADTLGHNKFCFYIDMKKIPTHDFFAVSRTLAF